MPLVCGIDIGLDGAVAVLDTTGKVVSIDRMPRTVSPHGKHMVDPVALKRLIPASSKLVVIEFTHTFGHESRSACFSFGRSTGITQSVLMMLGVPWEEVTPQMWKAEILEGTKKDKAAAVGYCKSRWPQRKVLSHDEADALCMAEFARRRMVGGITKQS